LDNPSDGGALVPIVAIAGEAPTVGGYYGDFSQVRISIPATYSEKISGIGEKRVIISTRIHF
jgi:hypothetical protein